MIYRFIDDWMFIGTLFIAIVALTLLIDQFIGEFVRRVNNVRRMRVSVSRFIRQ